MPGPASWVESPKSRLILPEGQLTGRRIGALKPRILHSPAYVTTQGPDAVKLAAIAGLFLDDWQKLCLRDALGMTAQGKWACSEVCIVVARQNGKGSIIEARELAGLFLFGERRIIHTAHEFKTASDGFERIWTLIKSAPELRREVAKVYTAHGSEGIMLHSGATLRFLARSSGSGRGLQGDCIFLDEAYKLDSRAVTALLPTMATRPNPQLWYMSSAPLADSEQLHAVRARGLELAGMAA